MFEAVEDSPVSTSAMSLQLSQLAANLPEFWQSSPASWFQHIEALFHLEGITADDSMYDLVIAALDQQFTCRVMKLLHTPLQEGRYAAFKQLLLRRDSLFAVERVDRLLSLSCLGDGTAVALMSTMLSLLGSDKGGFIFPHIFQRQLPPPEWPPVTTRVWLRKPIGSCWPLGSSLCKAWHRIPCSRRGRKRTRQQLLEWLPEGGTKGACGSTTSGLAAKLGTASRHAYSRNREMPRPALSSSCGHW